jgi:hypothetical protein
LMITTDSSINPSQSWIMYDLQFGVNLSDFFSKIDPLKQFHYIQVVQSTTILEAYGISNPNSCIVTKSYVNAALLLHQTAVQSTTILDAYGISNPNSCIVTKPNVNAALLSHQTSSTSAPLADPMGEAYFILSPHHHDIPIIIDTGTSHSITPNHSDFIGPIQPTSISDITGITSKARVVGKGKVEWVIAIIGIHFVLSIWKLILFLILLSICLALNHIFKKTMIKAVLHFVVRPHIRIT